MPDPVTTAGALDWVAESLRDLEQQGLRRRRRIGSGQQQGQPLVDFGSNDYLGLADDPRLAGAAARAAKQHGWGSGASPVVSGRSEVHAELEQRLVEFEGVEAALVFPSGFAANASVLPALVGTDDAIFTDAKNHASIIDGCRLSPAPRHVYRHGDPEDLRRALVAAPASRRRLIVTDTLFSMDGDMAPLDTIARLALEHEAMLVVDEAHATGVCGPTGRGVVEHFAVQDPLVEQAITLRIGTLSKALGSAGGFAAGSSELIDWLHNRARGYMFSTAMPPAVAAASIEALRLVDAEPERRTRVLALARELRQQLSERGWNTGNSASQIVPLIVGDPETAVTLSERLATSGFYVPAIRPPSVPEGESLLRISVSARHTEAELAALVSTLQAARSV